VVDGRGGVEWWVVVGVEVVEVVEVVDRELNERNCALH
jgi:hypothetical protein